MSDLPGLNQQLHRNLVYRLATACRCSLKCRKAAPVSGPEFGCERGQGGTIDHCRKGVGKAGNGDHGDDSFSGLRVAHKIGKQRSRNQGQIDWNK